MKKLFVLLAAVAFVVAFTVPAMSADWGFYGSARMYTFMDDESKEASGLGVSDGDLAWMLQGNSRIGAKVKAGAINGSFEYSSTPGLRLLNAAWKFGAGTLVVGQDYSPIDTFISNQQGPPKWGGDIDGLPWGGIYDGRVPQLKLKMASFQVALMQPKVVSATGLTPDDTDTSIPKIEASYTFKAGPLALKVLGGMNTHDDVVITGTTEKSYSVDSNVFGVMANFATGPFSVAANMFMATNPGNYGLLQDNSVMNATFSNNTVNDCDSTGALVVLGFKASDMIKLEAGYGMLSNEVEAAGVTTESETNSYYVQAVITLAKGVYIVPEYGSVDYGDKTETGAAPVKQGDISYFGAKWQINF
ncbi:MAG: porin [Deltaproteobacteria bacterium]|nr:porin [Deltaproteobacteria bacterium]